MTPAQIKAQDLIEKFRRCYALDIPDHIIKQYALIVVEEIIEGLESVRKFMSSTLTYSINDRIDFYTEVKTELKK